LPRREIGIDEHAQLACRDGFPTMQRRAEAAVEDTRDLNVTWHDPFVAADPAPPKRWS